MSTPSDAQGLAAVHVLVMRLLAELDRVTRLVDVPYFMAYGSAIGAVREHGLIAWDVDADVWMRHEHYRALTENAVGLLGPDFELLTAETHDDYEYLFPRLTMRGIHHAYIRVDIFPLDPAPSSALGRRASQKLMRLLDRAYFLKRADLGVRHFYDARKVAVARALKLLLAPVPASALRGAFRRLQARGSGAVLVNSCGAYGDREYFDAAWFESAVPMPVQGLELPVPVGYDALLTQLYGTYLTPVAAAQQAAETALATSAVVVPLREAGHLRGLEPSSPPAPGTATTEELL